MYPDPQIPGQIGGERQRDVLARAEQQRRAQRLRILSRGTRRAEQAEPHPGRAARTMAGLRAVLPRLTRHPVGRLQPTPDAPETPSFLRMAPGDGAVQEVRIQRPVTLTVYAV